ncbi:sugar ABC transporter permease [Streptomyces sp. NPDC046324]|uniref:sugar ABC transporter permease n=1 Tax=Streptomyces sp. NPDC046324 TaxID=3154915 RepID=UPI0033F78679
MSSSVRKPADGPSGSSAPGWARGALDEVLGRVGETLDEVGDRFPLFADPDTGRWTTSGRGSWTGGFWAGLLWLRARHTGEERDRAAASACTARLAAWVEADTATRGLILWYGTALADRDPGASALRTRAARACLEAYDPRLGLVPWGAALGGPRLLARADGVPGMVPLLATESATAAASHLRSHLDLCVQGAAGLRPAWRREDETDDWRPYEEPPPGWTRGRAWLLLAVADALLAAAGGPHGTHTGGDAESTETATDRAGTDALERRSAACGAPRAAAPDGPRHADERLLAALEFLLPRDGEPLVPVADEGVPGGPVDTSAAAITAVALLKLARLPDARSARHAERAVAVLSRLTAAHMSRGRLLDGCYDVRRGTAVRHELVWGDFFLALGLAALADGGRGGTVDLTTV